MVERRRGDQGLVRVRDDDPVRLGILAGLVGLDPGTLHDGSALQPVELGERSPVPRRVAAIGRVAEDGPDRPEAPLRVGVRGPVPIAGGGDAVAVQFDGDGLVSLAEVHACVEDPADDGDALRRRGNHLRHVTLAGGEALAARDDPDEATIGVVDLLVASLKPPDLLVGTAGGVLVHKVVAVGRGAAAPRS